MAYRVPGFDLQACPGPDTRASDLEYKDGHGIAAVEVGWLWRLYFYCEAGEKQLQEMALRSRAAWWM